MIKIYKFLMVLLVLLLFGCGTQDGATITPVVTTPPVVPPVVSDVFLVEALANPQVLGFGETSTITVNLFNSGGQLISTDTNTVTFGLSNSLASMIPISATTTGTLSEVLTAASSAGEITVTATSGTKSGSVTIQVTDPTQVVAGSISVTANPISITVGETAIVRATVLDTLGALMPDGTVVNFSIDNSALGSIVTSATTTNGIAQATFSSSLTNAGVVTVSATSGFAAPDTTPITVLDALAGDIQFVSADPQVIVLAGASGQKTSVVQFLVKDSSGAPIAGSQEVSFVLSGPNGGESLNVASASTVNGIVQVILTSGNIPGTVTVTATVVDNPVLKEQSGVIAIGGGVPSAGHFSLSTSVKNLEGFAFDGITADITARIADRYGNFNILEGTSVSFSAECGAVDRSISLDNVGVGTVVFRTQAPDPQDVDIKPGAANCDTCAVENTRILTYETIFGAGLITNGNNPRDGLCTIIAEVGGEEEFTDANANGFYDTGETFEDTYDDTHLEKDDDNFDILPADEAAGTPYDPTFEDLIVDRNLNGLFDGLSGAWDANKRISSPIRLLITGSPIITLSSSSVTVADGGSEIIYYSVHDLNFNTPVVGTTVSVSSDVGSLSGTDTVDFLDTSIPGPIVYSVTITDGSPGDADPPKVGVLEVTVNWLGNNFPFSIPVSVD